MIISSLRNCSFCHERNVPTNKEDNSLLICLAIIGIIGVIVAALGAGWRFSHIHPPNFKVWVALVSSGSGTTFISVVLAGTLYVVQRRQKELAIPLNNRPTQRIWPSFLPQDIRSLTIKDFRGNISHRKMWIFQDDQQSAVCYVKVPTKTQIEPPFMQQINDLLAYEMSELLEWHVVPEIYFFKDSEAISRKPWAKELLNSIDSSLHKEVIVQKHVEGHQPYGRDVSFNSGQRALLLNLILGRSDGGSHNSMLSGEEVYEIDNEILGKSYNAAISWLFLRAEIANEPLSPKLQKQILNFNPKEIKELFARIEEETGVDADGRIISLSDIFMSNLTKIQAQLKLDPKTTPNTLKKIIFSENSFPRD